LIHTPEIHSKLQTFGTGISCAIFGAYIRPKAEDPLIFARTVTGVALLLKNKVGIYYGHDNPQLFRFKLE